MKRLANEAGIQGKFTNHSLHATGVTHLFDANIPEKVIKEVSGHRSNAVQVYERPGEHFKCQVSETMSAPDPEFKAPEPKFSNSNVSKKHTRTEEITLEEPPQKHTVKIDVQRCMQSAAMSKILDNVPQE